MDTKRGNPAGEINDEEAASSSNESTEVTSDSQEPSVPVEAPKKKRGRPPKAAAVKDGAVVKKRPGRPAKKNKLDAKEHGETVADPAIDSISFYNNGNSEAALVDDDSATENIAEVEKPKKRGRKPAAAKKDEPAPKPSTSQVVKKRGRPAKNTAASSPVKQTTVQSSSTTETAKNGRGRGRPKKVTNEDAAPATNGSSVETKMVANADEAPATNGSNGALVETKKRGRGRPKKVQVPAEALDNN